MFRRPPIHNLSPTQVRGLLEKGEIVLVDVREPAEFAAERIRGAVNVPMSTFDPQPLSAQAERIVFQCGSGKRSAMAVERCQLAGVPVDAHMAGGIAAWRAANLPTETASRRG